MEKDEFSNLEFPSFDGEKDAVSAPLAHLNACLIAYEKFKEVGFLKGNIQIERYRYLTVQADKIIYVHTYISPEGSAFGGAATFAVDTETQKVVRTKIYK